MLVPPRGWGSRRAGDTVIVTAPGGRGAGVIAYDERVRPLGAITDLVKAAPPPDGFTPERMSSIEELVTREGEYAALVFVDGHLGGAPALVAYGFVLLDDFYARLLGVVTQASRFAEFRGTVRELVVSDAHMLGRVRRRRFRYTPPAGWRGEHRLFEARYVAPGGAPAIVVGPAVPKIPDLPAAIVAGVLGELDPGDAVRGPPVALATKHGLRGQRVALRLPMTFVDLVVLEDDAFVYSVKLEGGTGSAELAALVESIQPIPKSAELSASAAFVHWAD